MSQQTTALSPRERSAEAGVRLAPLRLERGWLVPLTMICVYVFGRPICLLTQGVLRMLGKHPGDRRSAGSRPRWY